MATVRSDERNMTGCEVLTEEGLCELYRSIQSNGRRYRALTHQRNASCARASQLEALRDIREGLTIRVVEWKGMKKSVVWLGPLVLQVLLGVFIAVLSVMLLWSETVIAFSSRRLSVWAGVVGSPGATVGSTLFWCFVAFSHVMGCVVFSLGRIRLGSFYNIVPRHTEPTSLLYSCMMLCRIVSAVVYNFFAVLQIGTDAIFDDVLGISDVPLLGERTNVTLPLLILPMALLVMFHVYGKLLGKIGVSRHVVEGDEAYDSLISAGVAYMAQSGQSPRSPSSFAPLIGGRRPPGRPTAVPRTWGGSEPSRREDSTLRGGSVQVANLSALGP